MEIFVGRNVTTYRATVGCRRLDDLHLGPPKDSPIPIFNDNNSCIALSKNPVHHDKSKHIAMRYHFLREKVKDGLIDLSHVSSADNIADLLTNPLPADTFSRLCECLVLSGYQCEEGCRNLVRPGNCQTATPGVSWCYRHASAHLLIPTYLSLSFLLCTRLCTISISDRSLCLYLCCGAQQFQVRVGISEICSHTGARQRSLRGRHPLPLA
jgi:hypothetical protein